MSDHHVTVMCTAAPPIQMHLLVQVNHSIELLGDGRILCACINMFLHFGNTVMYVGITIRDYPTMEAAVVY